jgi:hypothetical protein
MKKPIQKSMLVALSLIALGTQAFAAGRNQPAKKAAAPHANAAQATAPVEKKTFARNYGLAGCGLGSVLMGKRSAQIFAATTNGTSLNQSFGISFGTLNCVDSASEQMASRLDKFVVANKVALANDIARGEGETLASLSLLLDCADSAQLNSELQGQFGRIFPSHDVAPNEITDSIITVISTSDNLAGSCKTII